MIPLLAEDLASGGVTIPGWAVISALVTVVLAFVALGKLLLIEKDSKLALAKEFGKDYSADREKLLGTIATLTTRIEALAKILDEALVERDKIIDEGMELLRDVKTAVTALGRQP